MPGAPVGPVAAGLIESPGIASGRAAAASVSVAGLAEF